MLKMSQIENIVSAYKTLSKIPSILGGNLNKTGTKIASKWSIRNLDKGKPTKYLYNYILNDNLNVISESEFGSDVSNELLSAVSPKETFKAIIKEEKEKEIKKQYLEVWSKTTLAHSIDLTAYDVHGDVYADCEFGSLDWNHDESAIIYIAEKKLKKSEPYIKSKGEAKPSGCGEDVPIKGEEFIYRQDWGEQLVGKHFSVIVKCNIETETLTVLEGLPETWCPGQVRFAPDGINVIGTAWETEPRRLGLIFSTNRPSFIFQLTPDGKMTKLSQSGQAVRSPRVNCTGDVIWLQRDVGGPHQACLSLVARKNGSCEVTTLIEIIQTDINTVNNKKFYGIYNQALPNNCSSADGRIVFSTQQQNEVRAYVVDNDGKRIVDISNNCQPGSTTVLDVKNDVILANCTNITTPGELFVARLPPKGQETDIKWMQVSKPIEVPKSVKEATVEYMQLKHEGCDDSVNTFTAIYTAPKTQHKIPLIVYPHGGPHASFVNTFTMETAFFNMLGLATLQINYRGSIGCGHASTLYLMKRVGDADVKDCKLATDKAIACYQIDENKLCLYGGSHGGFLATHLSAQYPDTYKVVVSRNPVCDVATMFSGTDIPDWCTAEAGFPFTETGPPSEEQLLTMRRCSPLAHVHLVKAPTAMMLGSWDKRVPHCQGLEYYRRLKANGVKTRVYMYDDNHSLTSPAAEMDNMINSARWLIEHLQK